MSFQRSSAQFGGNTMDTVSACHAEDQVSIPGRGVASVHLALVCLNACVAPQTCPRVGKNWFDTSFVSRNRFDVEWNAPLPTRGLQGQ